MSRKWIVLLLSVLMVFSVVSCAEPDMEHDNGSDGGAQVPDTDVVVPDDVKREVKISISVNRDGKPAARAVLSGEDVRYPIKEELVLDEIRGKEPIYTLTPKYFIMNIPSLTVYEPNDLGDIEKGANAEIDVMKRATGDTLNMVNFLIDRGIPGLEITDENSEFFTRTWNGIYMHCSDYIGGFNAVEGYDCYYGGSFIGVKLPDGVAIDDVANARHASEFEKCNVYLDPSLAWFSWPDLVPHKGVSFDGICFQRGIREIGLVNAEGNELPLDGRPHWTFGPTSLQGGVSCLSLPLDNELDFRGRIVPEIEIEYDTDDLITLYKLEDGSYRACFNVKDPYPFSIAVDEYDPDEHLALPSSQREDDVREARLLSPLYARRPDGIGLTFIKPNYDDIHNVEIWHSEKDDINTSEYIWSGMDNSYLHEVEDVFAPHYYWGVIVNGDGERSNPVKFLRSNVCDGYKPDPKPEPKPDPDVGSDPLPDPVYDHLSDAGTVFRGNLNPDLSMIEGNPEMKLTPRFFLTTIGSADFYDAVDNTDASKGCRNSYPVGIKGSSGGLNIDLLDDAAVLEIDLMGASGRGLKDIWDGVGLDVNYGFRRGSATTPAKGTLIGIPAPVGLDAFDFDNSIHPGKDGSLGNNALIPRDHGNYIWFSLQGLIPVKGQSVQCFVFQNGLERGTYLNPTGESYTGWYGPFEQCDDTRSAVITKAVGEFDMRGDEEKVITVSIDPTDLIWCFSYDRGNGHRLYHAVLNLDRPFPISLNTKVKGK